MGARFYLILITGLLLLGCSTSRPRVSSNIPGRLPEVHGYINEASGLLDGMKLKNSLEWEFRQGQKHGRYYAVYSHELKRWVGGLHYPPAAGSGHRVLAAMYPDGSLGPNTGRWEAGRCILWDNGIKEGTEQEYRMRKAGLWR